MATTETFNSNGSWTVPDGVDQITVRLYGGQGDNNGNYTGGLGGYISITMSVTPGDVYHYWVGKQGQQLQGGSLYVKGGSASVWSYDYVYSNFSNWIACAAGGGGAGEDNSGGDGGDGGANIGGDGGDGGSQYGLGGTQTSGGAGGDSDANGESGEKGAGGSSSDDRVPGGGDGWYGGGAGSHYNGSDKVNPSDYAGGGGSNYADGVTVNSNIRGNRAGHGYIQVEYTQSLPPSQPTGQSASVNGNDSISVSWDSVSNVDNYRVEINRDGNGWISPSGGPTTLTSTSATYNPGSDSSYNSQVGIDSKFRFRVRGENTDGTSNWSYTSWVYTDPIPPHNPSVSRPDANTFEISWEAKSDIGELTRIEVREDTGSGYGSWNRVNWVNHGSSPYQFSVGTSYDAITLKEDARYQIRLRAVNNNPSPNVTSEWVYADYGNEGNVFFEDDFESQDFSAWDSVEQDALISSGSSSDSGFGSADQGTYWARLDASGRIEKNLGDLSGESDVIVKCALAAGSMDSNSEQAEIEWYDGSGWSNLVGLNWEYNKQGWVEVTALVPSGDLSTDNRIAFDQEGGGGDYTYIDRVVVSDILHEYTSPAAPSGLSLDTSTQREIGASWTNNSTFGDPYYRHRETGGSYSSYTNLGSGSQVNITALLDGEQYDVEIIERVLQSRQGSVASNFNASSITGTATTILEADTNINPVTDSGSEISLSWDDKCNNETQREVLFRQSGNTSWNIGATVSANVTSATVGSLDGDTEYELTTKVYTDHSSTEGSVVSTTTYLSASRTVESYSNPNGSEVSSLISVSAVLESHSNPISSSSKRIAELDRTVTSHTGPFGSSSGRNNLNFQRSNESSAAEMTSFVYNDRTSLELVDYEIDWDGEQAVWYTNWFQEIRIMGTEDSLALRARVVEGSKEPAAKLRVQYDETGNGVVDDESEIIEVGRNERVHSVDDIPLDESGYYRLKFINYSGYNSLKSVDVGIVN